MHIVFVAAKNMNKKKRCVTAAAAAVTAYVCVFVCMFDRHAVRRYKVFCTPVHMLEPSFTILLNGKQPGDWPL